MDKEMTETIKGMYADNDSIDLDLYFDGMFAGLEFALIAIRNRNASYDTPIIYELERNISDLKNCINSVKNKNKIK